MATRNESEKAREAQEAREKQLRNAITEGYLETGKMLNVPAIAALLSWSESKVRRVLDEARGAPNGVHPHRDGREWLYAPATWLLRDMVNELRKQTELSDRIRDIRKRVAP